MKPSDILTETYTDPKLGPWNNSQTGVRLTHISGIVVECHSERSQHANKARAFEELEELLSVHAKCTVHRVLVNEIILRKIIKALRRDAAKGRVNRGEMAGIIEASIAKL